MTSYQIGDMVRVREWKDMASKYKVNKQGSIVFGHSRIGEMIFSQSFIPVCGMEFEVVDIFMDTDGIQSIRLGNGTKRFWTWGEAVEFINSESDIDKFLEGYENGC